MRLKGDSAVEYRFGLIIKLYKEGKTQQQTADLAGCSQAWVSKVLHRYKAGGKSGLKVSSQARGKKALLDAARLRKLKTLLLKGAMNEGFATDNWTRARIATTIEQHFSVHYSAAHISRLMRRIGFSLQKPKRISFKKDQKQVTRWKEETLPQLKKKAQTEDYVLLYSDEASISVVTPLTRTYAPRGQTPVITTSTEVNLRLYMASAVSATGELQYMIRKQPFDSEAIISYLEHLQQTFPCRKLMIIWDGASIHDSEKVRSYLRLQKEPRLHLAMQPHYSPELNADEQVWNYLKQHKLKNTCNQTAAQLHAKITKAMISLQQQPHIVRQFFLQPDLAFYN